MRDIEQEVFLFTGLFRAREPERVLPGESCDTSFSPETDLFTVHGTPEGWALTNHF